MKNEDPGLGAQGLCGEGASLVRGKPPDRKLADAPPRAERVRDETLVAAAPARVGFLPPEGRVEVPEVGEPITGPP